VPSLRVKDEVVDVKEYAASQTRYSQNSFLPGLVARLSSVSQARSMLVGSVEVFPVQFNPAMRTVRKYSRLVIEVLFGAPVGQQVQNDDDAPFQNVLLNYGQAKAWKFENARQLSKTTVGPSVLATGNWYRLTVADDGVYILNAQYLAAAGINLSSVDPRTIKIFGNGGTEVPENITLPRPVDLVENAIDVEGEADGQFNPNDYVLFYGKSVRGWKYDPAGRTIRHYINHYTEVNYYWLTFGGSPGKRMQRQSSLTANPTIVPDKFLDGAFIEEEKVNLLKSGKDWYSFPISTGGSTTYTTSLPGLVPNQRVLYRYQLIARSQVSPMFTVKQEGVTVGTHQLAEVYYEGFYTYATALTNEAQVSSPLGNNTSRLTFTFNSGDVGGTGWIDWVEILYQRRFEAVNNFLPFRSPDSAGVVEYQLTQFSAAPLILNVSRPADVRLITGIVGTYTFRAAETGGQASEYYAVSSSAFKSPAGIIGIPNQNLRGVSSGADFIIITSPDFRSASDQLAAYREQPSHGNLRTLVADVNQICNEFGGGLPDITAIRDFLRYAYDNWTPQPKYVLMFGQGSYDYKGLVSSRSSRVPTWQSNESR
ncbi:MAG: C25 family cysteine peptidase, partial [bacterium]